MLGTSGVQGDDRRKPADSGAGYQAPLLVIQSVLNSAASPTTRQDRAPAQQPYPCGLAYETATPSGWQLLHRCTQFAEYSGAAYDCRARGSLALSRFRYTR
jgi:hypothetical protein